MRGWVLATWVGYLGAGAELGATRVGNLGCPGRGSGYLAWLRWLLGRCPCRAWCWLLGYLAWLGATWAPAHCLGAGPGVGLGARLEPGDGYLGWLLGVLVQGPVVASWIGFFGAWCCWLLGAVSGAAGPGKVVGCLCGVLCCLLGCPCKS